MKYERGKHPNSHQKQCKFQKGNQIGKGQIPWNKNKKCPQWSGKNHPRWKDGQVYHNGYILILQPSHPRANGRGYVKKHRLIIEKQIKRYLLPKEKCHHLNEIKDDNRLKNLMAFINDSAHQRFAHNPKNVKLHEIIFDGRKH